MKNFTILFAAILALAACASGEKSVYEAIVRYKKERQQEVCEKIKGIDWKNQSSTIKAYEECIASTQESKYYKKLQTDSKLYLSYIYLFNSEYQNIERANDLLKIAIQEMGADSVVIDNSGSYIINVCAEFLA